MVHILKTRGIWLYDLLVLHRDSLYLTIFALTILKGPKVWLSTPNFKVRIYRKPRPIPVRSGWRK